MLLLSVFIISFYIYCYFTVAKFKRECVSNMIISRHLIMRGYQFLFNISHKYNIAQIYRTLAQIGLIESY